MPSWPQDQQSNYTWGQELRNFLAPIFDLNTGAFVAGSVHNAALAQLPALGTAPSPPRQINITDAEITSITTRAKLPSTLVYDDEVNIFTQNTSFSQMTPGSVLFAGTGGILSQDNANIFWDNVNKRFGISNPNPSVTFEVTGPSKFNGNLTIANGNILYLGAESGIVWWNTSKDSVLYPGTGHKFVLGGNWFGGSQTDHENQINPTLFIHSATNPDINNTQWVSLTHNQTNAIFDLGMGAYVFSNGNIGAGVAGPTAILHLKAGTAAANTAPFKLTSGINLTTPEAGAFEYDGTNLYFTPASGVRKIITWS